MPATDDGARKLRVGLFTDSPSLPRWMVESFAAVSALDFVELLVIEDRGAVPRRLPWLWRAYSRVDASLFGSRPDPSERIELRTFIPRAVWLTLPAPASGSAIDAWRPQLAALHLDVAFLLDNVDDDDALADVARYGVWRFCFGEDYGPVDAVAGFREMSAGAPVTASGLRVSRGRGPDRLVYRSWSRTIPYSLAQNRRRFLMKTGAFAARALRRLHEGGDEWLDGCAPIARVGHAGSNGLPGALEIAHGLSRTGRRISHRALQRLLNVEQWFIAYRFGNGPWTGDLSGFVRLLPPTDRFWADPFALERSGRHYIFFEDFSFAAAKGCISVVEVDRSGACSEPVPVLEREYHLSYPFLLEHDGELFMIPETGHNRTVELYRCIDFPGRWRLEKVLLRGASFVDATVHRIGDRWWMFVNIGTEAGVADDELHLYHADHPFGEWTPHRANPVKSDTRCARPAGQLFERDGALYRPTQICAPLYGSGICINRIVSLTPESYHEEEVGRMLPSHSTGLLGIHTLNSAGELFVADGFIRRRRAWQWGAGALEPVRVVPGVVPAESPGA